MDAASFSACSMEASDGCEHSKDQSINARKKDNMRREASRIAIFLNHGVPGGNWMFGGVSL